MNPNTVSVVPTPTITAINDLFELVTTGGQPALDIVAIHGLHDHPYKTWQHENGVLWLRDLLPTDLPFARIMTFGWTSLLTSKKSNYDLDTLALRLLGKLADRRSSNAERSRPLIFICHDLGGAILEKVLVLASNRTFESKIKDILVNTKAVAYLGVPHEGLDTEKWATFAKNASKAAGVGMFKRLSVVKKFRNDSLSLTTLPAQFQGVSPYLRIISFYETKKLNKTIIMNEESAQSGRRNETLVPVDADHHTMCKFSSAESEEYRTIREGIMELVAFAVGEAAS